MTAASRAADRDLLAGMRLFERAPISKLGYGVGDHVWTITYPPRRTRRTRSKTSVYLRVLRVPCGE
jgi:hypothetical protein